MILIYIGLMVREIDPAKYAKASKLLNKGKTFEETRNILKSAFGMGLSRTTLTQLNQKPKK